jgi:predicted acetylornithine/succinylornithine family transaminase
MSRAETNVTDGELVMTTESLVETGNRTVSRNYSPAPIIMSHGDGAWLWDTEGRRYLDFLAGIAVSALGHNHPAMVAAIADQASRVMHISNAFWSEPQIRLQDRLTQLSGLDRVYMCNSGAEANEAAIKLVRRWQRVVRGTPRFEIITFTGSFHGRTYGAISATAQPKYHAGFEPMVPGFVYATFNDLSSVEALVGPHTAGILVEPVQGEGGVTPATQEFLQGLRAICDREGLALMMDEVQTGIGRTGTWFAYEQFGVRPDVLSLAKGLGGGFPVGAMLASAPLSEGFNRGSHASTFGGNPLGCRVALTVLEQIAAENLLSNARLQGEHFRQTLRNTLTSCPLVREVRGLGLMNGLELEASADVTARAVSLARNKGLLCNVAGTTVLRFVPPLAIDASQVEQGVAIVASVLQEILQSS